MTIESTVNVFVLQHVRESEDDEDVKLLGIYSSERNALNAQKRFSTKSGFIQYPDGFFIDKYVLDKDYWFEGF